MWRTRVVHTTGYVYQSPVTASYNEARLTPRSSSRQNLVLNRVETIPATRSYRYIDYWGTAVTAFDLHAPHTELTVTSSSVVETERPEPLAAKATVAPIGGLKLRRESALSQPGDLHHHVEVGDALPRVDPFQRGNVGVVAAYTHTDVLLGDLIVIGGVVVPPSTVPGLNPGMAAPVYRLSHHGITLRV